jgi:hypothetical protein
MSEPTGSTPQDIDEPTTPNPGAGASGGEERHDDSPGDEVAPDSITDDQLPEDLRPGDDNPLARPLPDGESADLGTGEPSSRDDGEDDRGSEAGGDQPD